MLFKEDQVFGHIHKVLTQRTNFISQCAVRRLLSVDTYFFKILKGFLVCLQVCRQVLQVCGLRHYFQVIDNLGDELFSLVDVFKNFSKIFIVIGNDKVFFIPSYLKADVAEVARMHQQGDIIVEHLKIFEESCPGNNVKKQMKA